MLAFPSMIATAAEEAGMKTPNFENLEDDWNFDQSQYPHFAVFCFVQLNRPMTDMAEHWNNAKVIAAIPDNEIFVVTLEELINRGLSWSN